MLDSAWAVRLAQAGTGHLDSAPGNGKRPRLAADHVKRGNTEDEGERKGDCGGRASAELLTSNQYESQGWG